MPDIRVDETIARDSKIVIYDRLGGGDITLSENGARHVRDRLNEVLGDD